MQFLRYTVRAVSALLATLMLLSAASAVELDENGCYWLNGIYVCDRK